MKLVSRHAAQPATKFMINDVVCLEMRETLRKMWT